MSLRQTANKGSVWPEDDKPVSFIDEDGGASRSEIVRSRNEVWNAQTGLWERMVQPGGGGGGSLTNTELRASPVPVTAASLPLPTNAAQDGADGASPPSIPGSGIRGWLRAIYDKLAGTLTVSGTVNVGNLPATQPVSGTFWQATQPVSAASLPLPANAAQEHATAASPASARLSDGAAYLGSTAQRLHVSDGGVALSVSGPLTDAQMRASAVPVSGPVTDAQLRASAVPTAPVAGTNRLGSVRVVDSGDADLTAAKNAQTARFLGTQDAKDSGRSQVMLSWEEMAGTAAAESALTNFTLGSRAASALSAANNLQVTAGKTLRIELITVYVKATSTVNNLARFRLRQAAAVANNSPVIFNAVLALELSTVAAVAIHSETFPIPDGLEVAAGQQITFTWFTAANTCTVGLSLVGYEY